MSSTKSTKHKKPQEVTEKMVDKTKGNKRTNFKEWQTEIMLDWLRKHLDNPYPDPSVKLKLANSANLEYEQVQHWFINVRMRKVRAMQLQAGITPTDRPYVKSIKRPNSRVKKEIKINVEEIKGHRDDSKKDPCWKPSTPSLCRQKKRKSSEKEGDESEEIVPAKRRRLSPNLKKKKKKDEASSESQLSPNSKKKKDEASSESQLSPNSKKKEDEAIKALLNLAWSPAAAVSVNTTPIENKATVLPPIPNNENKMSDFSPVIPISTGFDIDIEMNPIDVPQMLSNLPPFPTLPYYFWHTETDSTESLMIINAPSIGMLPPTVHI